MSLITAYHKFIIENVETVGYIETLLQAGYTITPSRFGGGNEVTSEGGKLLLQKNEKFLTFCSSLCSC